MHPQTFEENTRVAREGGEVTGAAKRAVEKRTGKSLLQKTVDFAQLFTV
ncbi:MAG: hypothetical protein FWD52_05020 [Candidatus Bathyarchaeota archaeon]|nr:hypothetical protein [Candidatus Termiticorpusculum sp.]